MNRFYEEGEAEEILRLALHQTDSGTIDRERLLAMAGELGISEEAVAKAEAQLASKRETEAARLRDQSERAAYRQHRRGRFWAEAGSYVSVNAFLVVLWWFMGHHYFWPGWVLACWGLNLVGDFFNAFFGHSEVSFQRWRRRNARRGGDPAKNQEEIEAYLDQTVPELRGRRRKAVRRLQERFDLDRTDAKEVVDDYYPRHGRS